MIVKLANWYLNTVTGALSSDIDLTDTEKTLDHTPLELLLCLIRYQGQEVTKDTMLSEVWPNKIVTEDVLSVAISQIRKALGDNARKPSFIKTIPGVGYKLIVDAVEVSPNAEQPTSKQKQVEQSYEQPNTEQQAPNRKVLILSALIIFSITIFVLNFTQQQDKNIVASVEQLPSQAIINHYQRGRYLLSLDGENNWLEAQQIFEDTIIQAPNFAPVYRELAETKYKINQHDTLALYEIYDELTFLLEKSNSLQPNVPATLQLIANISFWVGWDFNKAERYYRQLLKQAPDFEDAHFFYANFQLAKGDFELALKHIKIYINLKPQSYEYPSVAWVYNMMEDYDQALLEADKLSNVEQTHDIAFAYHVSKQGIFENAGNTEQAGKHLLGVLKLSKYSEEQTAEAEAIFQQGGLKGLYAWLLDTKKETDYIGQYQPPLSFARYAIGAGQLERAVDYLLAAKQKRQAELLWFNTDPKYKAVINHPKLVDFMPIQ